jgi:hypothetical protein|tara:strand:- start:41 stop:367 length:327 start_codon:yes stop_codon:yes gene_type:complete
VAVVARTCHSETILERFVARCIDCPSGCQITRAAISVQANRGFRGAKYLDVRMRVDLTVTKFRYISAELTRSVADDSSQIDIDQATRDKCGILIAYVEMRKDSSGPVV